MKAFRIFGLEIRFRRVPGPVKAAVENASRELTERSLRMAFALQDNDPRWKAWRFLIQRSIDAAADNAVRPHVASDHGLLAHSAGGVAHLRQFLDGVMEIRERALADVNSDAEE